MLKSASLKLFVHLFDYHFKGVVTIIVAEFDSNQTNVMDFKLILFIWF